MEKLKIGKTLRAFRKAKGMTAQDVADSLGVSRAAVILWEQDKREPSFSSLFNFANLYGVTVNDFAANVGGSPFRVLILPNVSEEDYRLLLRIVSLVAPPPTLAGNMMKNEHGKRKNASLCFVYTTICLVMFSFVLFGGAAKPDRARQKLKKGLSNRCRLRFIF